jgi:predicted RNA-binding protein with PUA-like domain
MNYWLVKQEPEKYAWTDLVRDKKTIWDGVRNYQARNNLKAMQKGDLVCFYHSVSDKQIMGIAKVSKAAWPDPSTEDDRWVVVELSAHLTLKKPVSLEQIKQTPALSQIALIRQSRLSVMPLDPLEYSIILQMAGHPG